MSKLVGSGFPKTKQFDSGLYYYRWDTRSRADADHAALKYRKMGYNARVFTQTFVYTHPTMSYRPDTVLYAVYVSPKPARSIGFLFLRRNKR